MNHKQKATSTIDFFIPACQTTNIKDNVFGICDDVDDEVKTPAYVSTDSSDRWIAIVKNDTGKPLNFTAVDNCIEILRPNGDIENRCDGILTNEEHIVFVELKAERSPGWISDAVDNQLQTTVNYFKASYDISKYRHKRAFLCNSKFPRFRSSYKERMNAFYHQNHIRLSIEQTITFK